MADAFFEQLKKKYQVGQTATKQSTALPVVQANPQQTITVGPAQNNQTITPPINRATFVGPLPPLQTITPPAKPLPVAGPESPHDLFKLSDGNVMSRQQLQTEMNRQPLKPQKESLPQIIKAQFDVADPNGFVGSVASGAKTLTNEVQRLGVEAYNVGAGTYKATHGDIAGANAELDKPRTIFGSEVKPTLTNSSKPGAKELLDVAGQGASLASNFLFPTGAYNIATQEGAQTLKAAIVNLAKTQTLPGALMGLGSSLQKGDSAAATFKNVVANSLLTTAIGMGLEGKQLAQLTVNEVKSIQNKVVEDLVRKGYSREEALQFAHEGGFFGLMPDKTPTMKASELVTHEIAPDTIKVGEYRDQIRAGEKLEPVKVIKEGDKYAVEDGKHRLEAYKKEGITDIPVEIVKGPEQKIKINNYQDKQLPTFTKNERGQFTGSKALPDLNLKKGNFEFPDYFKAEEAKRRLEPTLPLSEIDNSKIISEGYKNLPKAQRDVLISQLNDNSLKEIKVFRATTQNELAPGDFIALDKSHAEQYKSRSGGKVIEQTIPKDSLEFNQRAGDFQYKPKSLESNPEAGFAKIPNPTDIPLVKKGKDTLYPILATDQGAQDAYRTYVNAKAAAKEGANQEAAKLTNIPEKGGWDTILNYEKGTPTEHSGQIQQTFDALHNEATAKGLEVPYRENYVPQMYKQSPEEVQAAVAKYMADKGVAPEIIHDYINGKDLPTEVSNRLKLNPSFTKQRVLPSYEIAMQYGLTPKYTHPAQLVGAYKEALDTAVANRQLLQDLIKQGQIVPAAQAKTGYKALDLNFSPKGYYAEPKLANALNGVFRDEANLSFGQSLAKGAANTSKFTQELALSAGFPKTDINFFTAGQLIKEINSGIGEAALGHPIRGASNIGKSLSAFVRANSDAATIKFFTEKAPIIQKMAENGFDLSTRVGNFRDMYANMESSRTFKQVLGDGWNTAFQKKTFASFMPQLYVNTFEGAYKTALKKGLSDVEASSLAAEVTRNFHGLTEDVARSKGTQDALSAVFFAPKFREGIINTMWNTGKSITTELRNPAFAGNRKLAAGMAITYGMYQALNKKLNGTYTWQNEPGHENDVKVPLPNGQVMYVPFMPSFLSLPRNLYSGTKALASLDLRQATQNFSSTLSMPLQITSQIINNRDYFGNDIYKDTDTADVKAKKIAAYVGIDSGHPYVKLVRDLITPNTDFKKPLYQSLAEAAEFPVKFQSMNQISRNEFYKAVDAKTQSNAKDTRRIQPIYDHVQQLIEQGKDGEVQQIVDGLSNEDYAIYTKIKSSDKSKDTRDTEAKLYQTYQHIQDLKKQGKTAEVQKIVDDMSESDYHAYDLLRNRFQ